MYILKNVKSLSNTMFNKPQLEIQDLQQFWLLKKKNWRDCVSKFKIYEKKFLNRND